MTGLPHKATISMNSMCQWFAADKLNLSIEKTWYTALPPKFNANVDIQANGCKLELVKSCKYLGVITDVKLKWDDHIDYIC